MAVDLSQAPYHDDFDSSKNYHRVLFTPGRAVQAREFNQLQTLLQEQIKRFGNHVFQNGSMVIPGESNYNTNYEYVTVRDVQYDAISEILETNQVTLTGKTSGVVAQIMQYQPNMGADPITFYVQYLNGSEDGLVSRFLLSEEIELTTATGTLFAEAVCNGTGVGSVFTINAGIFYINGFFVENDAQSIILSRYSDTPSVVVGFRLKEATVDWTEDQTLLDNASGSTNLNAIGADRLKLTLELESHAFDSTFDKENFIQLAAFKNGIIQTLLTTTDYSVLEDTLARRTYDESGDYTVESFGLDVREHLDDGSNGGLFSVIEGGDDAKFVVGVEPGKAYVRGYEITNIATKYLEIDKAREVGTVDNSATTLVMGAYVETLAVPNTTPLIGKIVSFYSGTSATPGAVPSGTVLGSAMVISVERKSDGTMKLYLVRVRNAVDVADTSFIVNATTAYIAGAPAFTCLINKVLLGTSNAGLVFRLPITNVQTLLNVDGISDTSMTTVRQITATADTSGNIILTAGTNEVFVAPSATNSFASFGSTLREIATISTLGGTPTGKALTIAFGGAAASAVVTVTLEVVKQVATAKSKTLTPLTLTRTSAQIVNGNQYSLNKADATKLVSVIDVTSGLNITSKFSLKRNVFADYYGISYIQLNVGEVMPAGNVTISAEYFAHGSNGDFFSVNSYSIPYEDIPFETIGGVQVKASDLLDFRPRKPDDNNNNFTGAGFTSVEAPFNSTLLRADLKYYMPRIDKVFVNSKGIFGTVKGVPGDEPKEPKTPDNSMLLYRVNIPAYTNSIKDVAVEAINNRRYTMRDIGKLEDRISNLEYYVTLSLLETETSSMQITDSVTGLNRFKNGFITDSFVDHSVGNWTSADYKCSISPEFAFLRPEFSPDQVDMKFKAVGSGAVLTGSLVTLPYTEVNFLNQPYASNFLNVNPYAVYRWNGDMILSPSNDTWFDTVYTAPQVTYQVFNNGNLAQTWNSWQLYWAGSNASSSLYRVGNGNTTSTDGVNFNGSTDHNVVGSHTITSTSTSVEVVGDRVVDNSVIPYMRSRDVAFKSVGLKPSTKMFAFFDNVNVSAYCKQTGKAFGADMITDVDGNLEGIFNIPNNATLRFRTGTKQFTLIDNALNIKETSLAYGDADYSAKGTLVTRTQSILATQKISQTTVPWDPLAQSFFVEKDGGVFLTSIEVFFASKDPSSSITMEIRNMVNGYPGQDVVPYSKVTLNPSQVSISAGANVGTKFTFNSPVYLANGNEYCYVIMSNSNNYNVYIATMGNKVIGSNTYISKQPYVGVLFKSQNNTTWSEDQNSDMKFNINVAKFSTDTVFNANFVNNKTVAITLASNPLTSVSGTKVITAHVPNHNLVVGSKVVIAGVDVGPGIALSQLNKQQVVTTVIDADNFTFETTSNATSSGTFGGAAVSSERNMVLNTIYPSFQELLIENTNVDWTMSGVTGKSLSGTETPFVATPAYNITPNNNSDLPFPLLIPSVSDSTVVAGDYMTITAKMISYADNISPVIDINRAGVIGIANRINSPAVLNETAATGGNAIARYVTSVVGLKNPANALKLFLDINRPQGSNVSVFYKTGNSENEVVGKVWTALPTIVSVTASDVNSYSEAEFSKDDIPDFGFYQFKIVLTSVSSSAIPSCKRMRGLALGT
jgi:hypothetical protein